VDSTITEAQQLAEKIIQNVEKVIVGKREAVQLAVIALISQGHLLIEDAPGVGKTMLARSLAKSINCSFKRIQFTPDMHEYHWFFPRFFPGIRIHKMVLLMLLMNLYLICIIHSL